MPFQTSCAFTNASSSGHQMNSDIVLCDWSAYLALRWPLFIVLRTNLVNKQWYQARFSVLAEIRKAPYPWCRLRLNRTQLLPDAI